LILEGLFLYSSIIYIYI